MKCTVSVFADGISVTCQTTTMAQGLLFRRNIVEDLLRHCRLFQLLFLQTQYYIRFAPVQYKSLSDRFQYSVVSANGLDKYVDAVTFGPQLQTCALSNQGGVVFHSKHKQTLLVIPCKSRQTPVHAYRYISDFHNLASLRQIQKLWKLAGQTLLELMHSQKTNEWVLNTHGNTVAWLHVRIDPVGDSK